MTMGTLLYGFCCTYNSLENSWHHSPTLAKSHRQTGLHLKTQKRKLNRSYSVAYKKKTKNYQNKEITFRASGSSLNIRCDIIHKVMNENCTESEY